MVSDVKTHKRILAALGVYVASEIAVGAVLVRRGETRCERKVAEAFRRNRDHRLDRVATALGWLTDVSRAIATGLISVAGVQLATGRKDLAAQPAAALAIASATHVTTSVIVKRPRPDAQRLGTQQITSSYPSGHVGAITANAIVLSRIAEDAPAWFRRPFKAVCVAAPIVVGWARLRTAQHHLGDVVAGYANGIAAASAVLAWGQRPTPERAQQETV